jgi:hypothetical protein
MHDHADEIMDAFDRGVIWLLKILAFVLLLFFYLVGIAWYLDRTGETTRYQIPIVSAAEEQRIKQRFRFHGIWIAESDDHGWYYFMRDGKRCRL